MKVCNKCKETKDDIDFYNGSRECKTCEKERKKNKRQTKEYKIWYENYYKENKDKLNKDSKLKREEIKKDEIGYEKLLAHEYLLKVKLYEQKETIMCSCCKNEKPKEEFCVGNSYCSDCKKEKQSNNPKRKEYKKTYNEKNKEKNKEKRKKDKKRKEYNKEYQKKKNQDPKYKEKRNAYQRERRKNDKYWQLSERVRGSVREALLRYGPGKKEKTTEEYGIDIDAIYNKLGARPGSGNEWHLEHIIPCVLFDWFNSEHIRLCNSPANLRWFPAIDNSIKKDNIEYECFFDEELFKIALMLGINLEKFYELKKKKEADINIDINELGDKDGKIK